MVSRVVKYDDMGNIIYDGPARRGGDQVITQKSNLPFGLTPADIMKMFMMGILAVTFVVKTDQRLNAVEKATEYLSNFAKNSDVFNSSIFGTQFEGGKPINNNLDLSKIFRTEH